VSYHHGPSDDLENTVKVAPQTTKNRNPAYFLEKKYFKLDRAQHGYKNKYIGAQYSHKQLPVPPPKESAVKPQACCGATNEGTASSTGLHKLKLVNYI